MNKKYKIFLMPKIDNSGQVLLIVTILLTIMLGIGLSISNQTLSSIFRTSQSDSFQKVTAAAEGGLEKYLLLSDSALKNLVNNTNLVVNYNDSNLNANTKAVVTITPIDAQTPLVFDEVAVGQVATFYFADDFSRVGDYSGSSCIKISFEDPSPDYMLNVVVRNYSPTNFIATSLDKTYDATNSNQFKMQKYVIKDGSFQGSASPVPCGGGAYSFDGAAMMRIHPLTTTLKNIKVEVVDENLTIDLKKVTQGYKIVSTGSFISGDDKTTRVITARKFLDSPANVFDFTGFLE